MFKKLRKLVGISILCRYALQNLQNNMNCCFTIILFNFEQIGACGASGTGMQFVCQCFGHFRGFRILSPYRQTSIINVLSDTVTPFRQTSIINVLSDNVKFPFWLTSQTTAVCVAKFSHPPFPNAI